MYLFIYMRLMFSLLGFEEGKTI